MPGRLLDTNAVIALFAGDAAIGRALSGKPGVIIPVIAVGELFYGAEKSTRIEANLKRVEDFISEREVLVCDVEISRQYARIKNVLKAKGRPIPDNDMWIVAIAQQYRLTLVTRDAHFSEIDGLSLETW